MKDIVEEAQPELCCTLVHGTDQHLRVLHIRHLQLRTHFLFQEVIQSNGIIGNTHPGIGKDLFTESKVQLAQMRERHIAWGGEGRGGEGGRERGEGEW